MLGNEYNQGLVHVFFGNKYRKNFHLSNWHYVFCTKVKGKEINWMMK